MNIKVNIDSTFSFYLMQIRYKKKIAICDLSWKLPEKFGTNK